MRMLFGLSLQLGLAWGAALGPFPHESPFELGELSRRGGQGPPINIDLSVWRRGQTELQWYGDITVGTPPVIFKLIFDTGAGGALIPRNNCTTCGEHQLFDPTQSSTYSNVPGIRSQIWFGPQGGVTVPYPDPQGADCVNVTDVIGMAGRSVPTVFLLCDTYSTGLREEPPDGIFGLGADVTDNSTYWQLYRNGQLPRPEFSVSLVSDPSRNRAGVLTLGGSDPSLYIPGTLKKVPLDKEFLNPGRAGWILGVHGARVGNYTLVNSTNAAALVDTGGATIITPDNSTVAELYGRMSPLIQPIDDLGSWGAPCDALDRVLRDVTFTVGTIDQHVDVVVKKKYINVGEYAGKPGICQGVFTGPMFGGPMRNPKHPEQPAWILGSPFLRTVYTVWNAVEGTMGFATPSREDCT